MALYFGGQEVKKMWRGSQEIKKAWFGSQEFYPTSTPIGNLPVGTIIRVEESGVLQDFVIAQHDYISSGVTVIERRLCLENAVRFNETGVNGYAGQALDLFVSITYRNSMLGAGIVNALTPILIPYTRGSGNAGILTTPRDVFVLSATEVGLPANPSANIEGSRLDIYTDDNSSRVKYRDGDTSTACMHWTRSPNISDSYRVWVVLAAGAALSYSVEYSYYVSPALALNSSTLINSDMTIA